MIVLYLFGHMWFVEGLVAVSVRLHGNNLCIGLRRAIYNKRFVKSFSSVIIVNHWIEGMK